MHKQSLHENWMLRTAGDVSNVPSNVRNVTIPARVPGCVHTDLLRANLIPDPYAGLNEHELAWIGVTDWTYSTTFTADPAVFTHERIDLVCDGLDTIATIQLNGSEVAQTQNMHRGYRFDIKPLLRQGENTLTITFASPVRYAQRMREKLGRRPYVNGPGGPFNFIRKMACNFGWDWGPALVTSGIWKAVNLEGWSIARIDSITASVRHPKPQDFPSTLDGPDEGINPFTGQQYTPKDSLMFVDLHPRFEVTDSGRFRRPYHDRDNVAAELTIKLLDSTGADVTTISGIYGPGLDDIISVPVPNPQLWSPHGHGDQRTYVLDLQLISWGPDVKLGLLTRVFWRKNLPKSAGDSGRRTAGELLDEHSLRIGLRTIELDTSPDAIGSRFALKVNGKEIFCNGFNWIPDDCFLDRACEPGRVRERIQQCVDAGGNMLRVWGGGIFETDDFYDICDELGVLVWQDFLFACAMYPEEEPFRSEVEAEARYNVQRLAHHPSLAIWNGCNENIWAYKDWGWQTHEDVVGKTWGKGYYLDLLPRVCKELDPSRPYWAASPWSGDPDVENGLAPNLSTHGNKHVWEAWFREDYAAYRNFAPRFCSEFGFQGPARFASIASVVPPEARDFGSREMRHRQKSGDQVRDDGDQRNLRHLLRHFNLDGLAELLEALRSPNPNGQLPECGCEPLHAAKEKSRVNFDDLHYLLSLNQARALTLGVEWFRSRQPVCMGTLYWQLNDCWPGSTSWSCLDYGGGKKPLWYATRRFYAPQLLTIQPEGDALVLYANNDSDDPWQGAVRVRRMDFAGNVKGEHQVALMAEARRNVRLGVLPTSVAQPRDRAAEFIVADTAETARATYFFLPDKELNYPVAEFEPVLSQVSGGYELTINSRVLLRDVLVQADRIDPQATVEENLVTVLPGEAATFRFGTARRMTAQELTRPPVFNCANRFGRRS